MVASYEGGGGAFRFLLQAHQIREDTFLSDAGLLEAAQPSGPFWANDVLYGSGADEDERLGARLEFYTDGQYKTVLWAEIMQVRVPKPVTLRDLLWMPAGLQLKGSGETELVHLPALAPRSSTHKDDAVRLGRVSVMEEAANGSLTPFGGKLLAFDSELISLWDLRSAEAEGQGKRIACS